MLVLGGKARTEKVIIVEDTDAAAAVLGDKKATRVVGDLNRRSIRVGCVENARRRACLGGGFERVGACGREFRGRGPVKDHGKGDIDKSVAGRIEGCGLRAR